MTGKKDHIKELKPVEVEIPEGVEVTVEGKTLEVKGEKGTLSRTFKSPRVILSKKENIIVISTKTKRRQDRAITGTIHAHIQN
ncbi:MAG: 50S ribosomal protein L6, partial [Candidatus Altiarchaeota archaeon]